MSEQAPEAPARGKKENVFTRKIGPLPMWAWVAIIGGVIIAYSFYKSKTSAASTSTTGATTDASQVPQFVNQTYVQPSPPSAAPPAAAPPPVVTNPGGPSSGTGPAPVQPGGPMKAPVTRTEKLKYKGNLEQIAKRNHIDMEDLLEANPGLKKYKGTSHVFPVGTTVKIPPAGT